MKWLKIWGIFLSLISLYLTPPAFSVDGSCPSFFVKSLHHTGKGMRYWYEEQNGFMHVTGIPYDKLGCKQCHVRSCDKCHAVKKDGKMAFSISKAESLNNCLTCHRREALTYKLDKGSGQTDVHLAAGMNCVSCHHGEDVHGDGIVYQSMRTPGAVKAECMNCHKEEGTASFNATLKPHRIHRGKVDCAACHVRSTMTCYNCHFGRFLETKKKAGNFIPMKSFLLLINYHGKVTAGNVMPIVYKGKKFIAYAPYFTHSVMAKGRKCNDCHNNKAMHLIKAGKKVPAVTLKNGKVVSWKGVVPVVPDKLQWVYLDKEGKKWIPLKSNRKEQVQFADYGQPLTEKQLKMLSIPFARKRE